MSDLEILDRLLNGYDRRMTPSDKQGTPTLVSCEIYIRSFGSINPMTMDYQVDLYLRQSWTDLRFQSEYLTHALDLNDANLVKKIWKPEVFFANAKHADFQYVTVPNVLIRIEPDGHILYMLRLKLTFACMMDLYKYPLDSQLCTMEIASFSKTTKELELLWVINEPIKMTDGLKLPQFEIENAIASKCNATFHIGEYSCLVAQFYLKRSIGFHLVQSYLPTILIVVISWVSFWLDVEAIPARITLGVTTLLTISSKGSGIQANLPQVSYVKAMDVWMGVCTIFVFAALLEFTFVNYTWRKLSREKRNILRSLCGSKDDDDEVIKRAEKFDQSAIKDNQQVVKNKLRASRIDRICRVGFPVGYLIFNFFYWPYYLL
uniref:Uncharacterized protein n=1 Tax=Strigamia maritima TaxID=126957 RepID=T1J4I2_STRMM